MIGRTRLAAAVLALGLAASGCGSSGPGAPPTSPQPSELNDRGTGSTFDGAGLVPPQPRPHFTLTDTAGKKFAFGTRTAGHPTLVYFGYTKCPDVCPTTMFDIHDALRTLPTALQQQTYVVFVSTDVKRDTRPVIARWLASFSHGTKAHWVGLRGTKAQIDAAQASSHVALAQDGGRTHSAQVLLFGHDDYAHVTFLQSTTEAQQIAHDVPLVAKG